uniref:Transposase n=1 Tax=Globodera pallida TaxID=36090 RepID=A0A183CRW1_GLOPA
MCEALRNKFEVKAALLATGWAVEASADDYWACGLSLDDPWVGSSRHWRAPNQLERALEMIREEKRPLPQPTTQQLAVEAVVAQASACNFVVAVVLDAQVQPMFIKVADEVIGGQRRLQIGHRIRVQTVRWIAGNKRLAEIGCMEQPAWLHQGQVVCQAGAVAVENVTKPPLREGRKSDQTFHHGLCIGREWRRYRRAAPHAGGDTAEAVEKRTMGD